MVLFCTGLHAQKKNEDTTTRTVEGTVTNAANQPVAKAVVQLKNTKTLQIRSFITQEDGSYHFAGLERMWSTSSKPTMRAPPLPGKLSACLIARRPR